MIDGPGTAHPQIAGSRAVMSDRLTSVVGDLQLDAEQAAALLDLECELIVIIRSCALRTQGAYRSDRRKLRRAPHLCHDHAVVLFQALDHRTGRGRSADSDPFQR